MPFGGVKGRSPLRGLGQRPNKKGAKHEKSSDNRPRQHALRLYESG